MTKTVLFSSPIGDVVFPITPTSMDGMTIGANTPAAGTFTNVTASDLSISTVKTFTANGTTPVTVNDPTVTANSQILITLKTPGGTVGPKPYLTSITPGVGFTVVAASGDTSVYNYLRIS